MSAPSQFGPVYDRIAPRTTPWLAPPTNMFARILATGAATALGLVIGITASGYFLDPLLLINGESAARMTEAQMLAAVQLPASVVEQWTIFRPTGVRVQGAWLQWGFVSAPAVLLGVSAWSLWGRWG